MEGGTTVPQHVVTKQNMVLTLKVSLLFDADHKHAALWGYASRNSDRTRP